jgi:hypothetical protein
MAGIRRSVVPVVITAIMAAMTPIWITHFNFYARA